MIGAWRAHYNRIRPHSALGCRPPAPAALAIARQLPTPATMQSSHTAQTKIPVSSGRGDCNGTDISERNRRPPWPLWHQAGSDRAWPQNCWSRQPGTSPKCLYGCATSIDDGCGRPDDPGQCDQNIHSEPWGLPWLLTVTVHRGIVEPWGPVHSQEQRRSVRVAAEATPGVTAVVNNLYVDAL